MSDLPQFIRDLLATWWARVSLLIGVVSYLLSLYSGIQVPRSVLIAVTIAAWVVAPFDLYRRQRRQIDAQGKARLIIYPEEGSRYYVEVDEGSRQQNVSIFIALRLMVENKSERPAIIKQFGLRVAETGLNYPNIRPQTASRMLQTRRASVTVVGTGAFAKDTVYVEGYNYVKGTLAFHPNKATDIPKGEPAQIHCTLTLTDTEGNTVEREFAVGRY